MVSITMGGADGSGSPPASASSSEPTMRQRTATLRRSCEACRTVKARCVVEPAEASGQARVCKRCMNHGIDCVFENALARPKKLRYSARTRVKDVEEKLDGLIALISARQETSPQSPPKAPTPLALEPEVSAPVVTAPTPAGAIYEMNPLGIFKSPLINGFAAPVDVNFNFDHLPSLAGSDGALNPPAGHSLVSSYGDVIDRGLITEEDASRLLTNYTTHAEKQFPFVLLPPYVTVGYMRRKRPYVLLAILTAGAEMPLQARLALEYRKSFAQAMIVESKSSLDLLQSVLIFCIWHHQYFKPYSSQLYQLSQIAVTMAVEINLQNSALPIHASLLAPSVHPCPSHARTKRTPTEQMATEIERARTFLGTYCLSASIATAHRKPTHFKYDRRMDQASQFLANAQDVPSDINLLPYHVQVRKLAEDVDRVFGSIDQGGFNTDGRYIEAMVKDFERQYDQLRMSMTPEAWNNAALKCALTYLPVVIYEVGYRIPPEHQANFDAPPSTPCCNWCGSAARLGILMKCISAAHAYIDCYLALPLEEARHVTIVEVSRHVDAILLITRTALGFDTRNFQHGDLAAGRGDLIAATDVGRYLEASERKMAALVTLTEASDGGPGQEEKQDLFWQLRHIFRLSLAWYRTYILDKPAALRKLDQMDTSHQRAKLDVSPIFWISEATTIARNACKMSKEMDALPDHCPPGENMLETLSMCAQTQQVEVSAATAAGTPTTMDADPATTSASSAPVSGPEQCYGTTAHPGFDMSLDPSFEPIPAWSTDQSADLLSSIPQSTSMSPWFTL